MQQTITDSVLTKEGVRLLRDKKMVTILPKGLKEGSEYTLYRADNCIHVLSGTRKEWYATSPEHQTQVRNMLKESGLDFSPRPI